MIASCAIGPLELEGVTAEHPPMKAAKKLVADVRRLRGVVESLRAPERLSPKPQEKPDAGTPTGKRQRKQRRYEAI